MRPIGRLVCAMTLLAVTAEAAELIGLTVPPYPDGLLNQQGACIAQSRGLQNECDYSIAVLASPEGKPIVIAGERLAGRDDQQKAIWIITDTLSYPAIPEGHLLAAANCQLNGKDDETIIAVVRSQEEEWLSTVLWARRYDLSNEKFVEQPTSGVRCRNEAAGL